MIDALRDLLELAYKERIDYLELIYNVHGEQHNKHHIDGAYTVGKK